MSAKNLSLTSPEFVFFLALVKKALDPNSTAKLILSRDGIAVCFGKRRFCKSSGIDDLSTQFDRAIARLDKKKKASPEVSI